MIKERTTKTQRSQRSQRTLKIFVIFVSLWFLPSEAYSQQSDLIRKAYTGLSLREPAAERAGAVVRRVAPDSPASRAGVQEGDTVLKINDQILSDPIQFSILWDS